MPRDANKTLSTGALTKSDRTASRVERKLEDDDLFKQIGGQLGGKFDYSEWQRQEKPGDTAVPVKQVAPSREQPALSRRGAPSVLDRPTTETTYFTVGPRGSPLRVKSVTSSQCQHGARRPRATAQKPQSGVDKAKAERLKILQLRIQTRRQTLLEYRKRRERLLEDNMRLKEEIETNEGHAHDEVKKLLRKYEKFRGGIFTLNEKFTEDLSEAKEDYDATKIRTDAELSALENEVSEASDRLKQLQEELYVLLNYKDKEYPVKQLRIAELQKEIEQLAINHGEDEDDLQHVVEAEIDKYRKEHNQEHRSIMQKVTKSAISQMHPSLQDMAMQNMVMHKELEFHQKEIEQLENINKELEREVKSLLKNPKTNIKMQMFPEFYPSREKCTPDMEVVLDIPTREWLPI